MILDSPLNWLQNAVERRALQLATGYFHVNERRWIDEAPKPKPERIDRSLHTSLRLRRIQVWIRDEDFERMRKDDRKITYIRWAMEYCITHEKRGFVNLRKIFLASGLDQNEKLGVRRTAWNYPGFFTVTVNNRRIEDHVYLTEEAKQLMEDEINARYRRDESAAVRIVKKILMMAKDRRFPRRRLKYLQELYTLPSDFNTDFLRRHPNDFRLVETRAETYVELVSWDDKLSITEREKSVAAGKTPRDQGRYAFVISYPEGYKPNRVRLQELDVFQSLPFASPYEHSLPKFHTPEGQKRVLAIFHELLSFTVEKRAPIYDILRFAKVLDVPKTFSHTLLSCHPGIFYVSTCANQHFVFLREAYKKSDLIVENIDPLANIRKRYLDLMQIRPQHMHQVGGDYRYVPKMERGYISNKDHIIQEPDARYFPSHYGL